MIPQEKSKLGAVVRIRSKRTFKFEQLLEVTGMRAS